MERKNSLDSMTGQEFKEMIIKNEMILEELDTQALNTLFAYESDAVCRGENDDTLLCRCADLLSEREGDKERLDLQYGEMIRTALEPMTEQTKPTRRVRMRWKKLLVAAAVLSILVCCATVVSGAFGFNFYEMIKHATQQSPGTVVEEEPFTVIFMGKPTEYASIGEFLKSEQLDILYPSALPNGATVESIDVHHLEEIGDDIQIYTSDENILFSVYTVDQEPVFTPDQDIYTHDGREYVIFERYGRFCAAGYYEGYGYSIQASTREEVIYIINHMKEYD